MSFGFSYALSVTSSFVVGYGIYNNGNLLNPSFTFQLDVNL